MSGGIRMDFTCPNCGAGVGGFRGVHAHSLTIWCLNCGWSRNRNQAMREVLIDRSSGCKVGEVKG